LTVRYNWTHMLLLSSEVACTN